MIGFGSQLLIVILWLLIIKFCQITVYPYLKPALGKITCGLAYPAGLLILTFISWYLGILHLPVWLAVIPLAALGVYAFWKKSYSIDELKKEVKWDAVFLLSFVLMLFVRYIYPSINPSAGEHYMDAAFIGQIMLNPVVTPSDPWFAGGDLSIYYYLGHWMTGVMGNITGGISTVVYNLALPTVFALMVVSAYAIGVLVLKKNQWMPVFVLFMATPALYLSPIIYSGIIGMNGWIYKLWYHSAHIYAINEYPLWSVIWGDPHANVFSFFNQLFFICLLLVMLKQWKELSKSGSYLLVLLLSLSLGSMVGINTWDVFVYAPLYLVISFYVWYHFEGHDIKRIIPFALVPFLALLSYAPFIYSMLTGNSSTSHGVGLVLQGTDIFSFMAINGIFLVILFVYGILSLRKFSYLIAVPVIFALIGHLTAGIILLCILLLGIKYLNEDNKNFSPEVILGIAGLAILFFVEFFYLQVAGNPKSNTIFKLGLCAWIILSISVSVIVGKWLDRLNQREINCKEKKSNENFRISKLFAGILVIVCLLGSLFGIVGMTELGLPGGTLDGEAWIETFIPQVDEVSGIEYLRSIAQPGDVVVEGALHTDATYAGRVSAMTGVSTIVGWGDAGGHESVWRDNAKEIADRVNDVRKIYENSTETVSLMDKYGAEYLFVGALEMSQYNISLPDEGLKIIYSKDNVYILQRS